MTEPKKRYFAASNSADGFINYFPQIFGSGRCQRLYVVKGGPGTGKSCFMKQVGKVAESKGFPVTYYYCSSDADSLDGLMIGDGEIGLVDGTAPHVWEPETVGAFEQIVNLGVFWDADTLRCEKEPIHLLMAQKRNSYQGAYHYLSACGQVLREAEREVIGTVDREKMLRAAERLVRSRGASRGDYQEHVALCRAIGMGGRTRFDTYEGTASFLYTVEDYGGFGYLFLDAVYQACKLGGISVCVSRDPLLPERIDALQMTENGVTFSLCGEGIPVHVKRFVKLDAYRKQRSDYKRKLALAEELMLIAQGRLDEVKESHFALEAIYAAAMNFKSKETWTEAFCAKLFCKK